MPVATVLTACSGLTYKSYLEVQARKADYLANTLPYHATNFERLLAASAGNEDGGFLTGPTLTYADFALYEVIRQHTVLDRDWLQLWPALHGVEEDRATTAAVARA